MLTRTQFILSFSFLIILSILTAMINLNEELKNDIRSHFISNKRAVLAKVQGDILGDGQIYSIIKILFQNELILEVYKFDAQSNDLRLITKTTLPEKRDGYFLYNQNATNLFLQSLDSNKALNIFVPTYDENLIPRLRAYKFDESSNQLILLNENDFRL